MGRLNHWLRTDADAKPNGVVVYFWIIWFWFAVDAWWTVPRWLEWVLTVVAVYAFLVGVWRRAPRGEGERRASVAVFTNLAEFAIPFAGVMVKVREAYDAEAGVVLDRDEVATLVNALRLLASGVER